MGIATAAAGPSVLRVPGLDLEPLLKDDGGTESGALTQGAEKVFRPDQAAPDPLAPGAQPPPECSALLIHGAEPGGGQEPAVT